MAWWLPVYYVMAFTAVVLSAYTMQKVEKDRINSLAPPWLQWARRAGFIGMATALCVSIWDEASQMSLVVLVGTGIYSLTINAIALYLRSPPEDGKLIASSERRRGGIVQRSLSLLRNGLFRR